MIGQATDQCHQGGGEINSLVLTSYYLRGRKRNDDLAEHAMGPDTNPGY